MSKKTEKGQTINISGDVAGGINIGGGSKKYSTGETNIVIGNSNYVAGNVYTGGGEFIGRDVNTTTGSSTAEIRQLFEKLYSVIDVNLQISPRDKEDLKAEVKEIQSTILEAVQKNEEVDERFLSRRFRYIARVAPDILDVVVVTLGNPLAGLGVVVKKIAEKAKEEAKVSKAS
jgi:hypothetical protein